MLRPTPRLHAFMTSLAVCLTLIALAVVLTGCGPDSKDPDHHPTGFVRASPEPCRCSTRPPLILEKN